MSDDTTGLKMAMCDNCGFVDLSCMINSDCSCGGVFEEKWFAPKSELRKLIKEWRKQRTGNRDVDNAVEACADRLEALLDGS